MTDTRPLQEALRFVLSAGSLLQNMDNIAVTLATTAVAPAERILDDLNSVLGDLERAKNLVGAVADKLAEEADTKLAAMRAAARGEKDGKESDNGR